MAIRATIWDVGGVLASTVDERPRRAWESRLGLGPGALRELVLESDTAAAASVGKLDEDDVWAWVGTRLDLDLARLSRLRNDFWAGTRPNEHLIGFLTALRGRYKISILSNAWSGARRVYSEQLGLGGLVEDMVISAEVGMAKPNPEIYRLALGRINVGPDEAVFIDDEPANVDAARTLGMQAVLYTGDAAVLSAVRGLLSQDQPAQR